MVTLFKIPLFIAVFVKYNTINFENKDMGNANMISISINTCSTKILAN